MTNSLIESAGAVAFQRENAVVQPIKEVNRRALTLVDGKVRVLEVLSEQELNMFLQLPYSIYSDSTVWPGQDDFDAKTFFDPARNPYTSYIDMKPFIAVRDGEVVGRICAIGNDHFNKHWQDSVGFFGFFECINDQQVADELFQTVENHFKNNGIQKVWGPVSPTYQDEVGLLVDSFEKVPVKGLAYNPSYYMELFERRGYAKLKDTYHPSVEVNHLLAKIETKMEKLWPFIEDPNIIARYFDWDNMERDGEIVRDLFYQTFTHHWGYYPAETEEWLKMLENYKNEVPEDLFLILEDAGEPIAFALCFEDRNQDMYAERYGVKKKNRMKWDLVGIKPDYHRAGLGTFIVYNLLPGLEAHNIDELCGSWVLEDNYSSLGLCKSVGMDFHTTFRIFQKVL